MRPTSDRQTTAVDSSKASATDPLPWRQWCSADQSDWGCQPASIIVLLWGVATASWSVDFHPACEAWAYGLDQPDAEALLAAVRVLRDAGPTLGRPLVDGIKGSRRANMKELRPGSTGRTEIWVLFAFDKQRKALLLVGGDKSDDWTGWYETNIPIAHQRFDDHQAEIDKQRAAKTVGAQRKSGSSKGKGRR
jgi:hypothetical protein